MIARLLENNTNLKPLTLIPFKNKRLNPYSETVHIIVKVISILLQKKTKISRTIYIVNII